MYEPRRHGAQGRWNGVGEGLVVPVIVELAAVIGSGCQAVVRVSAGGGGQAEGEQQRQIGVFHGSTCEIGFPAFPQGH